MRYVFSNSMRISTPKHQLLLLVFALSLSLGVGGGAGTGVVVGVGAMEVTKRDGALWAQAATTSERTMDPRAIMNKGRRDNRHPM